MARRLAQQARHLQHAAEFWNGWRLLRDLLDIQLLGLTDRSRLGSVSDVCGVPRVAGRQLLPPDLQQHLAGLLQGPEPGGRLRRERADLVHGRDVGMRNGRQRAKRQSGLYRLRQWGAPVPELRDVDPQLVTDMLTS